MCDEIKMCSKLVDFIRSRCSQTKRDITQDYYDADEFAYEICSWIGRAPSGNNKLKVVQTMDSFGLSLVYKSLREVRSAGRIDVRLYCENQHDVPDMGLFVELNIYRRRAIGGNIGPWMLSERVCGSQEEILKRWK